VTVDYSFAFDCAIAVVLQLNSIDLFKGGGSLLVDAVSDSAVKQLPLYKAFMDCTDTLTRLFSLVTSVGTHLESNLRSFLTTETGNVGQRMWQLCISQMKKAYTVDVILLQLQLHLHEHSLKPAMKRSQQFFAQCIAEFELLFVNHML